MTGFRAPPGLRNRHIQSILASSALRKPLVRKNARRLLAVERGLVIDAGEGRRLHGLYSRHPDSDFLAGHQNGTGNGSGNEGLAERRLVVMIHGWEGSATSVYLLSAAASLYNAGFDVLRLHLRDHGPSHGLNKGIFHAARLEEVVLAVRNFVDKYQVSSIEEKRASSQTEPSKQDVSAAIGTGKPVVSVSKNPYLVGFSLGGNFALRVALNAPRVGLNLAHVVAVSPVIIPSHTFAAMEKGPAFYRRYFVHKWMRSLKRKSDIYPELYRWPEIRDLSTLGELTDYLVSRYTDFASVDEYFSSYALQAENFCDLPFPVDVITSSDDPVIPAADFHDFLNHEKALRCRMFPNGGHCGFIANYKLDAWVDRELVRLFSPS